METILEYFGRIVENVKEHERGGGYLSITIAAQFLRLFFNKENWTRESLVDKLQESHQMLDILIKELGGYM